MQPSGSSEYQPPSGYPPHETGPGAPPQPGSITGWGPTRVRPWITGVTAMITMLVLIGAIGNQGVSDAVIKHANDTTKFFDNVARSTTTYSWRFSPPGGHDVAHAWLAEWVVVVVTVVLTLLLSTALSAGKKGFWGPFLGTWAAVVVATVVAYWAHAAVLDTGQLTNPQLSKPVAMFYSQFSPGAYAVSAAFGFGLITALIAGVVAFASRRREVLTAPPAAYPPSGRPGVDEPVRDERQPWTPPPAASPSPWTPPPGRHEDEQHTVALNKLDAEREQGERAGEPQHTAVLPAVDSPSSGYGSSSGTHPREDESDATQAYRVPRREEQPAEGEATQAYRFSREGEPRESEQPAEGEATQAYRFPREGGPGEEQRPGNERPGNGDER